MIIYKYEFNIYNSINIEKTSHHLFNCISEHKEISYHSGLQLISPSFSTIREHIHNNQNEHSKL